MPIKKIEITWECVKCDNIYQIINSNRGKCPKCNFNIFLCGIDILTEEAAAGKPKKRKKNDHDQRIKRKIR